MAEHIKILYLSLEPALCCRDVQQGGVCQEPVGLVEILVPGEDDDDEMEIGKNEEQHDDVGESLWPRFQS